MSHVVREVWHVCPSHGCDYKAKHSGNLSKHLANFPHSSSETTAGITLDPLSIDSDSIGIDSIDLDDPPPTADHYRADIDGLRCIAVLLVIAFHAYPSFCPGGFIGVDMFFVISGYLITSILSRQIISAKPPFRRLDFFSRRIRRIFPTLLCTILFTILASRLILTPTDFRALGTMAAFSAAFCANINAARKLSTTTTATDYDYFDTVDTTEASASDPLLHLWSLGLEEQFYLVWPLLLPPLLSLPPTRLLWSFLALTLSSFFINLLVVYSPDYSAYAYYLPVTRFWEIWVGAFVVWQPKPQPHPTQLAFVGLTLLITSLIIIDSTTLFPAWATILPTVGTAAVIAAGPDTIVNRALANKLCVAVGLISYPLYLFHWPCLVLSRVADAAASPAIALAISLALTLLTFFLVEQPLRHRKSPRTPLILALAMTLLFILCVAISQELGFSGAPSPPAPWEPLLTNNSSNASRVFDKCLAQVSTATVAAATSMPGGWNYDVESSPYECYKKASPGSFFHMKVCELNPGSTNEAVIIVGDSHAEQWHARYDYLIRNNLTDANVVLISTSGCTALPLRKPVDITFDRKSTGEHHCCSCGNSTEAMLDVARQWRDEHAGGVRAIVWAAYWEYVRERSKFETRAASHHPSLTLASLAGTSWSI